jgi:hypothetical protein
MNSATTTASAARPNESWLFRVGGLAALAIGVAYIVIIALYASVGVQPAGAEARLDYFVGKTTTMLKSVFSRPTAYVGIATGVVGIAAVSGVDIAHYPECCCCHYLALGRWVPAISTCQVINPAAFTAGSLLDHRGGNGLTRHATGAQPCCLRSRFNCWARQRIPLGFT